jgi:hypothetical protein
VCKNINYIATSKHKTYKKARQRNQKGYVIKLLKLLTLARRQLSASSLIFVVICLGRSQQARRSSTSKKSYMHYIMITREYKRVRASITLPRQNIKAYKKARRRIPIRCNGIDIDDVLDDVPATRGSFPLRYLGLPLLIWSLRRRDFQFLED